MNASLMLFPHPFRQTGHLAVCFCFIGNTAANLFYDTKKNLFTVKKSLQCNKYLTKTRTVWLNPIFEAWSALNAHPWSNLATCTADISYKSLPEARFWSLTYTSKAFLFNLMCILVSHLYFYKTQGFQSHNDDFRLVGSSEVGGACSKWAF